jgi:WD40 repeat protein
VNPLTGQPVGASIRATSAQTGVLGVAFSPNGELLASADNDGTVRMWNPVTGQPAGTPLLTNLTASTQASVSAVTFVRDGSLLASADNDGTAQLWNPVTGQPVGTPFQPASTPYSLGYGPVFYTAVSPIGNLLASIESDGTVHFWNPVTGQPTGTSLPAGPPGSGSASEMVVFSPNGKLLAFADGNGTVQLWNPLTGKLVGAPLNLNLRRVPRAGKRVDLRKRSYSQVWLLATSAGRARLRRAVRTHVLALV